MDEININQTLVKEQSININPTENIIIDVSQEVVNIDKKIENYTLKLEETPDVILNFNKTPETELKLIGTVVSIDANYDHTLLYNRDNPDQHPISAITGLQQALDTYIYEQGIASSEWVINHNLNKFPSVTVVDSADNEIIASVKYQDANTCIIEMSSPFKGKAYLN